MIDDVTIAAAEAYAASCFTGDASGHDLQHTLRVRRTACHLAREEGADERAVELAALLHDVDDAKLSPQTAERQERARSFLAGQGVPADQAEEVLAAIREVSFSHNRDMPPSTLEAACVRDADRLDALGAIGIARTFAYGGAHGRALHDPTGADASTSIQHFHDKLLLLKDMMCTESGRRLAEWRHRVLQAFLDEFMREWEGES